MIILIDTKKAFDIINRVKATQNNESHREVTTEQMLNSI